MKELLRRTPRGLMRRIAIGLADMPGEIAEVEVPADTHDALSAAICAYVKEQDAGERGILRSPASPLRAYEVGWDHVDRSTKEKDTPMSENARRLYDLGLRNARGLYGPGWEFLSGEQRRGALALQVLTIIGGQDQLRPELAQELADAVVTAERL